MAFKRLDTEDFIVSADSITAPAWSGYAPTLTNMYTSSVQVNGNSGNYYLNVYQYDPSGVSASLSEIQFNVTYGNQNGSGSLLYNAGINGLSPTRTIYGQFRNLIYGDENATFNFNDVVQSLSSKHKSKEISIDKLVNKLQSTMTNMSKDLSASGIDVGPLNQLSQLSSNIPLPDGSSITPEATRNNLNSMSQNTDDMIGGLMNMANGLLSKSGQSIDMSSLMSSVMMNIDPNIISMNHLTSDELDNKK